jgi:PPOX class probable F420-dependent enzyme
MLDLSTTKDKHIDERLRSEPIIWLASTRPDGKPHAIPVWFWWDGETVLMFSKPDAQKIRNLRRSPHVVLALNATDEGEDVAIIEGVAELVERPTSELMLPAFADKYAELFKRIGSDPIKMAAEYNQPIRVTPTKFLAWYPE